LGHRVGRTIIESYAVRVSRPKFPTTTPWNTICSICNTDKDQTSQQNW